MAAIPTLTRPAFQTGVKASPAQAPEAQPRLSSLTQPPPGGSLFGVPEMLSTGLCFPSPRKARPVACYVAGPSCPVLTTSQPPPPPAPHHLVPLEDRSQGPSCSPFTPFLGQTPSTGRFLRAGPHLSGLRGVLRTCHSAGGRWLCWANWTDGRGCAGWQ